jgi:hypothetical protein
MRTSPETAATKTATEPVLARSFRGRIYHDSAACYFYDSGAVFIAKSAVAHVKRAQAAI